MSEVFLETELKNTDQKSSMVVYSAKARNQNRMK